MTKKIVSPSFRLNWENAPSLVKSAAICVMALFFLQLIKVFFPEVDIGQFNTQVITLVMAWVVNTVKEFVQEK